MKSKSLPLFALGSAALLSVNVHAATPLTWDGDTSTTFSATANWVGGVAPANNLATHQAVFSGTITTFLPNLTSTQSVSGLDFQSAGWTFAASSGTLTIGADGIDSTGAGTNTVSAPISVGAVSTWTLGSGNTLNMSGVLSSGFNFDTAGSGIIRMSGASANTYTGDITIGAGTTLEIDKVNVAAIGNSQDAIVNGTVKWLQAGVAGNSARYVVNATGLLDLNGNNASFAYSGSDKITLSGGTVQTGAGTWTMTGNNSGNGAVINGNMVSTITGNVDMGAADRTSFISDSASGLDFNFAANITDVSSGGTTRAMMFTAASGTPEVSLGGNNAYRGLTTINAGVTLYADHANALGTTASSTTVAAGATLALRGGLTYAAETVSIAFSPTAGLRSVSGNNTWAGVVTNPGGSSNTAGTIQVDAGSLTVTGSLSAFTSTSRQLGKTGAGALIYDNAANNIAGNLFVNDGVFAFTPSGEINTRAANVAVNGGTIASPDNITLALGGSGGSNTIRFGANGGGFAAYGADINVDLGGISTLVWGGSTVSQVAVLKAIGGAVSITSNIYFGGTGYNGSEVVAITGGGGTGATASITVSGGVVTAATMLTAGSGYTIDPTMTIGAPTSDGGTTNFLANNAPLILNSTVSQNKVTMLDNIDLAASGATFTGQREIRVLDNTGSTADRAVIDSVISSSKPGVGINKTGAGVLEYAAGRTMIYDGVTTVSAGTLLVNGSITGTGAVTVNSGATIGGSGTIAGATTILAGGIHAPGNSPGIEKFTGNLTYADASIFAWDIDRAATQTRGTGYDAVDVTGTLAGLDGGDVNATTDAIFRIVINEANFSNAFWSANNHTWTNIFTGADGTTVKANWTDIFGGGFQYYNGNTAIAAPTTGSFSMTGTTLSWNFSAVPEPTSAVAGLLLGAGLLRRRRDS